MIGRTHHDALPRRPVPAHGHALPLVEPLPSLARLAVLEDDAEREHNEAQAEPAQIDVDEVPRIKGACPEGRVLLVEVGPKDNVGMAVVGGEVGGDEGVAHPIHQAKIDLAMASEGQQGRVILTAGEAAGREALGSGERGRSIREARGEVRGGCLT